MPTETAPLPAPPACGACGVPIDEWPEDSDEGVYCPFAAENHERPSCPGCGDDLTVGRHDRCHLIP